MTIKLKGSTDGSVSLTAPADTSPSGTDITMTLPTTAGSANQFVKNSGTAGTLEYSSMVEDSSNKVGIGTSSPKAGLHVKSNSIGIPAAGVAGTMQVGDGSSFGLMLGCNGSGVGYIQPQRNDGATSTYNLLLNPNGGNVGIGEDNPENRLHIRTTQVMSTSAGSTPGIFLHQEGGSEGSGNYGAGICFSKINSGRPGGCISSVQSGSDNDHMGLSFFTSSSSSPTDAVTEQFRIRHDGQLFGTDTSISTLSDQRLKENINSFSYSLDTFKLLQPKVFDWKNPELHGNRGRQRGFVAQDIESVDSYWLDEYSVNTESADAQYLDEDRAAKTSKLGQKDAMYVSVIQQLLSKIETLETKVAALEAGS